MKYIATREGVEKTTPDGPVAKEQKKFIAEFLLPGFHKAVCYGFLARLAETRVQNNGRKGHAPAEESAGACVV